MRIRKRQVPFPLAEVALSDPHRISRSTVAVQLVNDAATSSPEASCTHDGSAAAPIPSSDRHQPLDQPLPLIGKLTAEGCEGSFGDGAAYRGKLEKESCLVEDDDEDRREQEGGEGHNGNDTRKGCILGTETPPLESFSPSSPSKQGERWRKGEKTVPFKKRRGGFPNGHDSKNKGEMKTKAKTSKVEEGWVQEDDDGITKDEEEEDKAMVIETKAHNKKKVSGNKKQRARGGPLMEGSRCSRVNGRGWRCCQPTLVGYSLCEHHLGKGRLRSMTGVRSRPIATPNPTGAPKKLPQVPSSSSSSKESAIATCVSDNNDEKKEVMLASTKKRMKLGTVKARSISSLLGQTNTELDDK